MEQRAMGNLLGLSFMRWWFFIIPRAGMTLFVGYVCYLGWINLGPHKPVPDMARMKAADRAVEKIADDVYKGRGDVRSAALCHFANDTSDSVSKKLRERLEASNVLDLSDSGFSEKMRMVLNLREKGAASADEALAAVRNDEVDGVLWGSLDRFETVGGVATLTGTWQLVDRRTGKVVCGGQISEGAGALDVSAGLNALGKSSEDVEIAASAVPWHLRLLGFVLIALLLPVVTISFIRTMVARRSNRINAYVLCIYTVVDMILAFFMVGGAFGSSAAVLVFLAASALAFLYNVSLMSFALRLESE